MTEKIESRDSEIENLKNENHALEEKLIEIQDIRNTSQNSDDEFQSAIEALQSTLQEVKYFDSFFDFTISRKNRAPLIFKEVIFKGYFNPKMSRNFYGCTIR